MLYYIMCECLAYRAQDSFPDPRQMKALMVENPGVPLKIALTDTNNITFYDLDYADLDFTTTSVLNPSLAAAVPRSAKDHSQMTTLVDDSDDV
jgi:hypothetical protein